MVGIKIRQECFRKILYFNPLNASIMKRYFLFLLTLMSACRNSSPPYILDPSQQESVNNTLKQIIEPRSASASCDSIVLDFIEKHPNSELMKWENKAKIIALYRYEYDDNENLSACQANSPFNNILVITEKQNPNISLFIFPSIEEEDFEFRKFYENKSILVFSYYSSPVGYTQFFIIDTDKVLCYKTKEIDEEEGIISRINNIDIESRYIELVVDDAKTKKNIFLDSLHTYPGFLSQEATE